MITEMTANDNYHTALTYNKKIKEYWMNHYNNYSWPSEKQLPSFSNLEVVRYDDSEYTICHQSLYQDIVDSSGRPDYKVIEGISFLEDHTKYNEAFIYKGYKVRICHELGTIILFNWIRHLGSNINSHLLGILVGEGNNLYDYSFKFYYSRIQKELNETKENINGALKRLKELNLITVKRRGADDLIITLNKSSISQISPKDFDTDESLALLNNYYGLSLSRDDEEEEEYERAR